MANTPKVVGAEHRALFARVFGEPTERRSSMTDIRALSPLEWHMFARALGQKSVTNTQKSTAENNVRHRELRITVANFLSNCTDLTSIIRDCEQCLQHLRKPCANVLRWHQRALQRQFLRHLRDKCYNALQSSSEYPQRQSEPQHDRQKETFFL